MCFSGGESAFFQNLDDTIYLNDDTASGSLIFTVITGGPVNSTYMTTSSSVFVFNDTSSTRFNYKKKTQISTIYILSMIKNQKQYDVYPFNDKKPKPLRCISFQW